MIDAMLAVTAGCSIGDKKKHLTSEYKNIFCMGKQKNSLEKYVINAIKSEVLPQERDKGFYKIYKIHI
ncbi:MAG: hypothetical protein LBP40_03640 [Campylobacteraceae bacterium]|nr:hypothetical protein [Campylobacteraceae bacterium]